MESELDDVPDPWDRLLGYLLDLQGQEVELRWGTPGGPHGWLRGRLRAGTGVVDTRGGVSIYMEDNEDASIALFRDSVTEVEWDDDEPPEELIVRDGLVQVEVTLRGPSAAV